MIVCVSLLRPMCGMKATLEHPSRDINRLLIVPKEHLTYCNSPGSIFLYPQGAGNIRAAKPELMQGVLKEMSERRLRISGVPKGPLETDN